MAAENNVSGIRTAKTHIKISDAPKEGYIECDKNQTLGIAVECRGSIQRGMADEVRFYFGDGSSEVVRPRKSVIP